MNKIRRIVFFAGFSIALIAMPLRAQLLTCATLVSEDQIALESEYTDSIQEVGQLDRTFHITIHVVKDENGDTGIESSLFQQSLNEVNSVFETIGVRFSISTILPVNNFNYNTIYYNNTDNELVNQSYVTNTINIYLVNKVYDVDGRIACSYTFMPADEKDLIFIQKSCFDGITLSQLLGHFFNLYHTHETIFSAELVDKSNCTQAGDLCCDTEATPKLTGLVNSDCEYQGSLKDENGNFYTPRAGNYMSFAPQTCKCFFSDQQYIRMLNAMVKFKSHLW